MIDYASEQHNQLLRKRQLNLINYAKPLPLKLEKIQI